MKIECEKLRNALETDDQLTIYAEFYNLFESIFSFIRNNQSHGNKEEISGRIQLFQEIQSRLAGLYEKIKLVEKSEILFNLELLEGMCESL